MHTDTPTQVTYKGTRESFEAIRTFLQAWTKELVYLERNERDDTVECGFKSIRGKDNTITIHKGETLYATDKRLV